MCGRYNNNANAYQCCTCTDDDCVIEGQAWFHNDEGSACSNGDNDNCAAGLVCGRYNNNADAYQCCTCTYNGCAIEGQAWCRNDKGGLCSDENNNNCATGLVCGHTSEISLYNSYTCCEDYYLSNGIVICMQYGVTITSVSVNVDPDISIMYIEQELLDETVNTLGGRRSLGATVPLLEEQDDQEHRKLVPRKLLQCLLV